MQQNPNKQIFQVQPYHLKHEDNDFKLTLQALEDVIDTHFSSSSVMNSLGFRSTQPGLAINSLRNTPATVTSPAASAYTILNSSGMFHLQSGFSLCALKCLQEYLQDSEEK